MEKIVKVWTPKDIEQTRMFKFMQYVVGKHNVEIKNYQQLHAWSVDNLALFWRDICDFFQIEFSRPASQIINNYQHMIEAKWFEGATLNFAEKLLSRRDNHCALIEVDENDNRRVISYAQLYKLVTQCAEGLKKSGVTSGDRVVAVLPNSSYAVIAMLAASSIGAIWSSCSPDFGASAIIDRFSQIEPKVLFICDGHQYLGKVHNTADKINQIFNKISSIKKIVLCPVINSQLVQKNIILWEDFLTESHNFSFAQLPFNHPLYILYSSGTTGTPKCIVHGAGGTLLQHLKEHGLHGDINNNDIICFYTTCGWMMWNWVVSALAFGVTLVLYEGAPLYPTDERLFKIIELEKITVFGTSAKFISAVEKTGFKPNHIYSMASLRIILSTGSPLLPKNYDFVYQFIKSDIQLNSISGGTDIVSCFALGNPISPIYRGEIQCLGLGMAVDVFDEKGKSIMLTPGELVCTKPFPSMPISFWQDDNKLRYRKAYFDLFHDVWAHGDLVEITEHRGLIIYGRSDAVLNPGGVRIGTAEIYRQVEKVSEVVDSVVIGQNWQDDVRVVLFVKLKGSIQLDDELQAKIRQTIRLNTSPRHSPAIILQVLDIPRTISGKIVELAVRDVVHGRDIKNLNSLANPEALEYFKNRAELM